MLRVVDPCALYRVNQPLCLEWISLYFEVDSTSKKVIHDMSPKEWISIPLCALSIACKESNVKL